MRKAFFAFVCAALCAVTVWPQQVTNTAGKLQPATSAPSGTCSPRNSVRVNAAKIYICPQSGTATWTEIGGGSGTTINSTNGQLPYRVNGTTFGDSAISSNALNATGISVTSAAAGSGVTVAATSSGANENLILSSKGSGVTTLTSTTTNFSSASFYITFAGSPAFENGGGGLLRFAQGFATVRLDATTPHLVIGSAGDLGITKFAAGVARLTNGSTGAGQLLIGTSTDTADAQLSVYSQSTTRPGLKLRALSGTASSQNVLESYNASGTLTFSVNALGSMNLAAGAGITIIAGDVDANNFLVHSASSVQWSDGVSGYNTKLFSGGANVLEQRNGTNAQTFRLYNTDNGANDEYLSLGWSGNVLAIQNVQTGTGTLRPLTVASRFSQSSKTSGYTVTNADTNTAFDNIGAGAGVTFTLPTPAAGLNYRFCRVANQTVTLDITGSETIQIGASVTTAGGNVTLDAVGSCVHIWAVNTTQWFGLLSGAATFN